MRKTIFVMTAILALCGRDNVSAAVAWRENLSGVSIPDHGVQGRLRGREFALQDATLNGNILELRQGEDFFPLGYPGLVLESEDGTTVARVVEE